MQRKEECTDWARKLSEQIVPFREEGTIVRIPPPEPATVAKAAEEPVPIPAAPPVPPVTPAGTPPPDRTVPLIRQIHTPPDMASAEDIFAKHARMAGLAFPQVPKVTEPEAPARGSHRTIFIVGAIVLFILAVAAGAWVLTQYHPQRPGQPAAPAATTPVGSPIITMVPTTVPGTTPPPPTPVPSGTPVSGSEESPVTVPTNGVWVKVQYSGNYTGVIGGGSTLLPVEGSGNKLFQITIKSGIIRVMVEKSDGSGRQMVIDVFRDGDRINHGETNIPHGEVNLQFELAPPTTATTVPAMTPVNSTAP